MALIALINPITLINLITLINPITPINPIALINPIAPMAPIYRFLFLAASLARVISSLMPPFSRNSRFWYSSSFSNRLSA